MGDNFLKRQIRNFKKRRDQAMAELAHATLLDRPEVLTTVYSAKPINGTQFAVGETLYAMVNAVGNGVDLIRGHQQIGQLIGESAEALCIAMHYASPTIAVRVESVSEVARRATVEIIQG